MNEIFRSISALYLCLSVLFLYHKTIFWKMILNLPYIFQNIYFNFYLNQTSCRYVTDNIRAFGRRLARSICVMRYIIVKRYPCWARASWIFSRYPEKRCSCTASKSFITPQGRSLRWMSFLAPRGGRLLFTGEVNLWRGVDRLVVGGGSRANYLACFGGCFRCTLRFAARGSAIE